MIEKIEIVINNGAAIERKILIVANQHKCYIDSQIYNISDETIYRILDILASWKYEYGSSNVIDAEEFNVKVYDATSVTSYHGKGILPLNYTEFKGVIDGIRTN